MSEMIDTPKKMKLRIIRYKQKDQASGSMLKPGKRIPLSQMSSSGRVPPNYTIYPLLYTDFLMSSHSYPSQLYNAESNCAFTTTKFTMITTSAMAIDSLVLRSYFCVMIRGTRYFNDFNSHSLLGLCSVVVSDPSTELFLSTSILN